MGRGVWNYEWNVVGVMGEIGGGEEDRFDLNVLYVCMNIK